MNMSPKNFPARAALGEVGRVGAGRGEVALDRRAHALDPARVELPAQADDAVAVVGGDVGVADCDQIAGGDQVGESTWMTRLAIFSRVLAA